MKKHNILISMIIVAITVSSLCTGCTSASSKTPSVVDTNEEDVLIGYERNEELLETSQGPGIFDLNGMELEAEDGIEVKSILVDYASYFGIEHCAEQLELSSEDDVLGEKYYRYQQWYGEYPVYGKEVIVTSADDKIVSVIENTARIEEAVTTYKEDALQLICETLGIDMDSLLASCKWYLYDIEGQYTTAIAITTKYGESIVADANTGKIIKRSRMIDTVKSVELELQGQVVNRKVNAIKDNDEYYLVDTQRNIYVYDLSKNNEYLNYDDKFSKGNLISFKNEKKCKSSSAVDALYNIEKVYDFYKEKFKHKSSDGKGNTTIRIFDGFDEYIDNEGKKDRYYDNAAAWGRPDHGTTEILISPRKGTTYANDLDVMGHEFTHSVIHYIIKDDFLDSEGDALNEGIADIMGLMIEAYYNGKHECDWKVGDARDYSSNQVKQKYTEFTKNIDEHDGGTIICSVAHQIWEGNSESKEMEPINNPEIMAELWYRTIMMISRDLNYEQCRTITELNALNMYRLRKITKKQYECILWAFDTAEIKYRLKSGVSNLLDRFGIFSNAYPANMDIFALVYDHEGGVTEEYNARVLNSAKKIVQETSGEPLVMNLSFGNYKIEIMEKESGTIVYRGVIRIRDFPDSVKKYFLDNELNVLSIKTELGAKAFSLPNDDSDEDTWKVIKEDTSSKNYDSYKNVIDILENEYGSLTLTIKDQYKDVIENITEVNGLCYLSLIDFNNDGVKELLAVAKHEKDPEYTVMAYTEENGQAVQLLSSAKLTDATWTGDYLCLLSDKNNHTFIDRRQWGGEWDYDEIYGYEEGGFKLISNSCRAYNFEKGEWDNYIVEEVPDVVDPMKLNRRLVSQDEYVKKAPLATGASNTETNYICLAIPDTEIGSGNYYGFDFKALQDSIDKVKRELAGVDNGTADNNEAWRQSYIDYIETDPNIAINPEWCTCGLIYVDNNEIPELIIEYSNEADGTGIVSFKNGETTSYRFSRTGGIRYIEREGLVYNSIGVMGAFVDEIVFLDSEGFHDYGHGHRYGESQDFTNFTHFVWNDEEVSEEEYMGNIDKYDNVQLKNWNSYSGDFQSNNYRPIEMCEYLLGNY